MEKDTEKYIEVLESKIKYLTSRVKYLEDRLYKNESWHSTGQPYPYKPADGQW